MTLQDDSVENEVVRLSKVKRLFVLFQTAVFAAFLLMALFSYLFQQLPHYLSGNHLADLSVNVLSASQQAFPGDNINFLVTINNHGPSNARDVYLVVTLPPDVEYQKVSPSDNLEVSHNQLTWTLKTLLANQSVQIDFLGVVNPDLSSQKELEVKAEIFSAAVDTNNENDISVSTLGVVLPSSISGVVWGDINIDGVRDSTETPRKNYPVALYADQTLISQTVTNDKGEYQFANVYSGTYYLNFNTLDNVLFSPKDATSDDLDSEPFPETGITELISVTSGEQESAWDAGIFFPLYMPVILNKFVAAPDLIVKQIEVDYASNFAEIEIQNVGTAATKDAFWVDLYVNPQPIPTMTNQLCHDSITCTGTLVWGITKTVSLAPGDSITIFTGDSFFSQTISTFTSSFTIGMQIYVQVDSDNKHTDYGNILETHEIHDQPYNNIFP
ncbi:MAG: hypothetical protein DHS20C20_07340 [Ardenticatenaceae bacterium]|nr:MAG: hypothetical protein DHS20C20_07340 [Ardenticatenaceae bacterium]